MKKLFILQQIASIFLITIALSLFVLLFTPLVKDAYDFICNVIKAECYLGSQENTTIRDSYPNFYFIRIFAERALLILGLLTGAAIFFRTLKVLLSRLSAKANRNFVFPITLFIITGFFLSIVVGFIDNRCASFRGPGGRVLHYGPAPKLEVEQQHLSDNEGMNYQDSNYRWFKGTIAVNKQGFFSNIDYDTETSDSLRKSGKDIVFIVGDSFIEGVSDGPYSTTLIEVLRLKAKDYIVYSFGVGGSDPLNYYLIVRKFVAELKPSLVLVAFCYNDVMFYDRQPTPYVPLYFQTNIGWLESNVPYTLCGKYNMILSSPQMAYEYYKHFLFVDPSVSLKNWFASRLSLTSKILVNGFQPIYTEPANHFRETVAFKYIDMMDTICLMNNATLKLAFVPYLNDLYTSKEQFASDYKDVLHRFVDSIYIPLNILTRSDYISETNPHFTISGNQKYAAFLDSVIKTSLVKNVPSNNNTPQ